MWWFPSPGFTAGEYQHIPQQVMYLYYKNSLAPPSMHAHRWDINDELQQQQWLDSSKSTLGTPHPSTCKVTWKRKDLSHAISENTSINLIQMWTGHWREIDTIRAEFTWRFLWYSIILALQVPASLPWLSRQTTDQFKCRCLYCEYQDLVTSHTGGYKNLSSKAASCFVHLLGKWINWLKEIVWKVSSR